ncbi:MAG: small basic protein [Candidatus Omnitrophota bacterium]
MSLHSSLKIDKASATQRTVQTRIERIKDMMKKGLWKEDSTVIGLPKTKIVRVKAKKKVKAEGDAAAPAAGATAGKPAAAAKPAAGGAKK